MSEHDTDILLWSKHQAELLCGATPQNGRQRILKPLGLAQRDNTVSLVMTYRSFRRVWQASTRLDTPPCSACHYPDSVIARGPAITGRSSVGRGQ